MSRPDGVIGPMLAVRNVTVLACDCAPSAKTGRSSLRVSVKGPDGSDIAAPPASRRRIANEDRQRRTLRQRRPATSGTGCGGLRIQSASANSIAIGNAGIATECGRAGSDSLRSIPTTPGTGHYSGYSVSRRPFMKRFSQSRTAHARSADSRRPDAIIKAGRSDAWLSTIAIGAVRSAASCASHATPGLVSSRTIRVASKPLRPISGRP